MQGHEREDHMMDIGKNPSGCGKWGEKRPDEPKKDEGIGQSKLGGMGMMGGWTEVGAQLAIGLKLITNSPLGAFWEG
jgi:hypothetical protein